MPLPNLLRKASSYILGDSTTDTRTNLYQDGETLFCKNNVCVHPPVRQHCDVVHHPGYLTITCRITESSGTPTLSLSWIPNTTLRKHPTTLENVTSKLYVPSLHGKITESGNYEKLDVCLEVKEPIDCKDCERICSGGCEEEGSPKINTEIGEGQMKSPAATLSGNHNEDNGISLSRLRFESAQLNEPIECDHCEENCSRCGEGLSKIKNEIKGQIKYAKGTDLAEKPNDDGKSSRWRYESTEHKQAFEQNKCTNICWAKCAEASSTSQITKEIINEPQIRCAQARELSEKLDEDNGRNSNRLRSKSIEVEESMDQKDCKRMCSSECAGGLSSTSQSTEEMKAQMRSPQDSAGKHNENIGASSNTLRSDSIEVQEPVEPKDCMSQISGEMKAQITFSQHVDLSDKQEEDDRRLSRSESIDSSSIADNVSSSINNNLLMSMKSRSMSWSSCDLSLNASSDPDYPSWMRSPELLALQHNLTFPDSATASPVAVRRSQTCRRFSVDLGQMRSLRLFFADSACTSGQLVVASRESQYKILHFHHGGLDRLANTLHQWHQLLYPKKEEITETEGVLPYRHFMVCRAEVARDELHPEEGQVSMITSLAWKDLLNDRGQVEDDLALRKGIFFGGLEPALRKIVWPFLLHCYSYQSTAEDREQLDAIRRQEYEEIERRRCGMNAGEAEIFWRNVVCIVEKDVVRTDRANPYYAGENNPNIRVMKNILLNYAVYNPQLGYTQGMSDLLAPLLAELNSETDAFWCFAGLMQRSVAVCTPTDTDMDKNLCYLRSLIKLMIPDFYAHLEKHTDALELLFCHRWILLCLKREFPTETALRMWEACWVNYLTDYFHLFLCLSIMCIYADDVIAQDLRTDEMLLHFSSLAMYMEGNVILRKARGLLYQFRQLDRLPCTLAGLCRQCGTGMWDSTHNPVIECIEHVEGTCPYLEKYQGVKY